MESKFDNQKSKPERIEIRASSALDALIKIENEREVHFDDEEPSNFNRSRDDDGKWTLKCLGAEGGLVNI